MSAEKSSLTKVAAVLVVHGPRESIDGWVQCQSQIVPELQQRQTNIEFRSKFLSALHDK